MHQNNFECGPARTNGRHQSLAAPVSFSGSGRARFLAEMQEQGESAEADREPKEHGRRQLETLARLVGARPCAAGVDPALQLLNRPASLRTGSALRVVLLSPVVAVHESHGLPPSLRRQSSGSVLSAREVCGNEYRDAVVSGVLAGIFRSAHVAAIAAAITFVVLFPLLWK